MGNNQSVSPNSTGFVNPNFITGNVPDHDDWSVWGSSIKMRSYV